MLGVWLYGLMAIAASCGKAVARVPSVRLAWTLQGDTAVLLRGSWAPPTSGTPPFDYYVDAGPTAGGSWRFQDTTAELSDSALVLLPDTATASAWCVAAHNRAGTGPQACASFTLPARVGLPGAPDSVEIHVDTLGLPVARIDGTPRWDGGSAVAAYLAPIEGAARFIVSRGAQADTERARLAPPCWPSEAAELDITSDSVMVRCTDGRTYAWTDSTPAGRLPADSAACGTLWNADVHPADCRFDVVPYYLVTWALPARSSERLTIVALDSGGAELGRLALSVRTP